MLKRFLLLIFFVAIGGSSIRAQEIALHDGDRVGFYGDSITAQRYYTRFLEDFVLTRYPKMHVEMFNAGVSGDTVNGGYTGDTATRLQRDLFPHRPTVVTVMLGMNDGYYVPFEQKYMDIFADGYRKLLGSIQTNLPGVKITLISPTPYDEVTHGTEFAHYNETVTRYAAFVKDLAATSHLGFSDFNLAVSNLAEAGVKKNPSLAQLLIPDRIHPGEAAQWVMAATLAKSWGFSPVVSKVHLDAAQTAPVTADNAQISGLAFQDGKLKWTELDGSLPLALNLEDGMVEYVLVASDLADMDQEMLRVDHLTAQRYELKIDGRLVATFDRRQLANGVNLALFATPMESQARDVDGTEQKRTRLDEAHFIVAVEDPKAPDAAEGTKALEEKDALLAAEQRKAAQPVSRAFELDPEETTR